MPINIAITNGPEPSPTFVNPTTLQGLVREHGDTAATGANPAAITIPRITTDQRELNWETRRSGRTVEFRFNTGTLRLTINQQIAMNATLNECERREWLEHENEHVSDNFGLGPQVERRFRASALFQTLFVRREWRSRDDFRSTQQSIQDQVAEIFGELTRAATRQRDTPANYAAVRSRIRSQCR